MTRRHSNNDVTRRYALQHMPLLDVIVPCDNPEGFAWVYANAPGGDYGSHIVECSAVPLQSVQLGHSEIEKLKRIFGPDALTKNNFNGESDNRAAWLRLRKDFALVEFWRFGRDSKLEEAAHYDLLADIHPKSLAVAEKKDVSRAINKEAQFLGSMPIAHQLGGGLHSATWQATQFVLWQKGKSMPVPAIFAPDVATALRVLMLITSRLPKGVVAKCQNPECSSLFTRRKPQHFYCDKKECRNLANALRQKRARRRAGRLKKGRTA